MVVDRVGSAQIEQNQMDTLSLWDRVVKESRASLASYIQTELEEMQSNPSDDFKCLALKSNPYDWQFAVRGPNGTEFEGGIYHGRIQFSENYLERPIFTLLTENGRFKTQTELSFNWSFSLSPRERSVGDGALGSVEYDKEERRALAIKSREVPRFGTTERQELINEIHEYMLSKVPPVPSNGGGDIPLSSQNDRDGRQQDINFIIGNTIIADRCKQVGIFEFGKRVKSLLWGS